MRYTKTAEAKAGTFLPVPFMARTGVSLSG